MYDDLCPLVIEAKSYPDFEACYKEANGLGKYGMRVML